jgi:hypothetical protein
VWAFRASGRLARLGEIANFGGWRGDDKQPKQDTALHLEKIEFLGREFVSDGRD